MLTVSRDSSRIPAVRPPESKYIGRLGPRSASLECIVAARAESVFDSAEDLARRDGGLEQHEMRLWRCGDCNAPPRA